jgi:anti-anti-sigma factor
MRGPGLTVTRERIDERVECLSFEGGLDMASAVEARETMLGVIAESRQAEVIVDFRGVDFIDSSGVNALVRAAAAKRRRGGDLVLVGCRSGIRQMLDRAGIAGAFRFANDLEEALRTVRAG